jgi:hypothetical protein
MLYSSKSAGKNKRHLFERAAAASIDETATGYAVSSTLRNTFVISYAVILLFLIINLRLTGNTVHHRSRFPLSAIILFRFVTALAVLFAGIFGTSLSPFQLLLTVAILSLFNCIFAVMGLQKTGKEKMHDSVIHRRWGLR